MGMGRGRDAWGAIKMIRRRADTKREREKETIAETSLPLMLSVVGHWSPAVTNRSLVLCVNWSSVIGHCRGKTTDEDQ